MQALQMAAKYKQWYKISTSYFSSMYQFKGNKTRDLWTLLPIFSFQTIIHTSGTQTTTALSDIVKQLTKCQNCQAT